MKKILMLMTSHRRMDNTKETTGVWLGEFTDPYYEFLDAGYRITLASPLGGKPPIDPWSKLTGKITASNRRFLKDEDAKADFKTTLVLDHIDAKDFDAIFISGGHGPMWDLANSKACGQLLLNFYYSGKPIASICHGPAALTKAAEMDNRLLRGKRVTAFSDTEEKIIRLFDNVPFSLKQKLEAQGAEYHSALLPFTSHVEVDGLLITGQNPASANRAAKALLKHLEVKKKV